MILSIRWGGGGVLHDYQIQINFAKDPPHCNIKKLPKIKIFVNGEKNLPLEEAIKTAVKYCIENEILEKFFKDNASEVINMLMHEFTIEEIAEIRGQEKYEQGIEQGIEHEKLIIAKNLLSEDAAPEFIQKITGLDLETISALNSSG